MTEYIEYCSNSSITEAWAVIQGTPGAIQDSEAGALENIASKKNDNFEQKPSVVFVERKDKDDTIPAFWHKQLSWNNNTYLSRIGHRYLSVHFIKQNNGKYETYLQSLRPQIEEWLDSYKETVDGQKEHYPIEKVKFGYINLLKIPSEDFDLSRYFKVNFGTGVSSADSGIGNLEITFSIPEPYVKISVRVVPESQNSETLIVTTQVEAHKFIKNDCTFENNEKILELIDEIKGVAKSVFFDLATDETHRIMGAKKHAASTT